MKARKEEKIGNAVRAGKEGSEPGKAEKAEKAPKGGKPTGSETVMRSRTKEKILKGTVIGVLVIPLFFGWSTPAPKGTSYAGPPSGVSDIRLLCDLTYRKGQETIHEQRILEEQLSMIREAKEFIVADLFLYNDFYNTEAGSYPDSTRQMTEALIARKKEVKDLKIYLITDEINNSYRADMNEQFQLLEENGITVIITDLDKVRDSNPLYSGYYRAYFRHFGQGKEGWLSNPFGDNGPEMNIRNYLRLLNFKANHRKVLITDQAAMVSSANPHDASSYHSNIAFQFRGAAAVSLLESEKAVASFSGTEISGIEYRYDPLDLRANTSVTVLTEDKIRDAILDSLKGTESGDEVMLGMFYLSHRDIIEELLAAAKRGVSVRVVLDPNKDAFGFEKSGIPNRQTAAELMEQSGGTIQVRWYLTQGEQYHAKILGICKGNETTLIGGSANYTRRNLDNYNMETDLMVQVAAEDPLAVEFQDYFDRIWYNRDGIYTGDYSEYEDNSLWKVLVYRFQEKTGLGTF